MAELFLLSSFQNTKAVRGGEMIGRNRKEKKIEKGKDKKKERKRQRQKQTHTNRLTKTNRYLDIKRQTDM